MRLDGGFDGMGSMRGSLTIKLVAPSQELLLEEFISEVPCESRHPA